MPVLGKEKVDKGLSLDDVVADDTDMLSLLWFVRAKVFMATAALHFLRC